MAVFVSQKNNHWLSLNYFLERLNKATFPSRPTIGKPLSVTAVKGGRWPSQSDAQRPLPPSRTVALLIEDGRFSRNSRMNQRNLRGAEACRVGAYVAPKIIKGLGR